LDSSFQQKEISAGFGKDWINKKKKKKKKTERQKQVVAKDCRIEKNRNNK
jgi:hypothetical protein